jgi:hypothetical protein
MEETKLKNRLLWLSPIGLTNILCARSATDYIISFGEWIVKQMEGVIPQRNWGSTQEWVAERVGVVWQGIMATWMRTRGGGFAPVDISFLFMNSLDVGVTPNDQRRI